jgi:predicted thioredoxin/glutaredoxin
MNRLTELFRSKSTPTAIPHLHDNVPNFTRPSAKLEPRALELEIFVGGRCPICQANRGNIEQLRRDLPSVNIRVIDLDEPGTTRPRNLIAIPSFFLNGHLVATGNPEVSELKRFIVSLSN